MNRTVERGKTWIVRPGSMGRSAVNAFRGGLSTFSVRGRAWWGPSCLCICSHELIQYGGTSFPPNPQKLDTWVWVHVRSCVLRDTGSSCRIDPEIDSAFTRTQKRKDSIHVNIFKIHNVLNYLSTQKNNKNLLVVQNRYPFQIRPISQTRHPSVKATYNGNIRNYCLIFHTRIYIEVNHTVTGMGN